MENVEKFSRMATVWRNWIPKSLAREDPGELIAFLALASRAGGISQSDLKAAMKISQSRLSRLTMRMRKEKWVEVAHPEKDHRILLTSITPIAALAMSEVEKAFAGISSKREVTKKTQRGKIQRNAYGSFI